MPLKYLRHFMLCTIILSCALFAQADDRDPKRKFADSIADIIIQDQRERVYKEFSPSLLRAYSHRELISPLGLIQIAYGRLLSYDFRAFTMGWREVSGNRIKIVEYTYAVATSKYPRGRFLKIQVTHEEGHLYLAGYSVIQFLETDEPDFLKPKK